MAGLMKPVTHLLLPFMRYWLPDVAVRRRKFLFCFKVQHPRNSHPVPSFSLPFEFPGGSFAITWLFRGRLLHYCRILASVASPPRSFPSWPPAMLTFGSLVLQYSNLLNFWTLYFFWRNTEVLHQKQPVQSSFGICYIMLHSLFLKWLVQLILLHFSQGTCFREWIPYWLLLCLLGLSRNCLFFCSTRFHSSCTWIE